MSSRFAPSRARFSAEARRTRASLETDFAAEAERLLTLVQRRDLVRAFDATAALLTVGDAIIQSYQRAKRRAGALDFPDLISKTRNLLSRSDAAQWVLYKLDRRVEHILVDEAQDTSPDQWMVVKAIAEDFFSGEGAARAPRTIFAVGDDKQSIFRFQGAVPAMLVEMERFFREADRGRRGSPSSRGRSTFRSARRRRCCRRSTRCSTRASLARSPRRPTRHTHLIGPPSPATWCSCRASRGRRSEEPEDWTEPYTAPSAAETELAERIADEILRIRGMLLPSGKRLRDGEILILVRRRDAFAAAMNRALRTRRIVTAGADRIPVSTHIAVLDLLALADVMLLPEDDLQLAAALKSPLLGINEEALMRLAAERRSSLWRALRDTDDLLLRFAADALRRWRGMADQITPFRFFATLLGPEGGRQRFRARLGGEADDVLDTFLSQALAYEQTEPPSLQGFVRFIRANESDIKRETDEAATGVRVMTVHGAKGLEADVVFLADTGGAAVVPQLRKTLVDIGKDRDDPAFMWRRVAVEAPGLQRDADAREDRETESEYLRLLYVAMTRARDVLYVAGVRLLKEPPRCWYTIVAGALLPKNVERDEDGELAASYQWPQPARPPLAPTDEGARVEEAHPELPAWLTTNAAPPKPAPGAAPAFRCARRARSASRGCRRGRRGAGRRRAAARTPRASAPRDAAPRGGLGAHARRRAASGGRACRRSGACRDNPARGGSRSRRSGPRTILRAGKPRRGRDRWRTSDRKGPLRRQRADRPAASRRCGLAPHRLQDRPENPRRAGRDTRPMSSRWLSTAGF